MGVELNERLEMSVLSLLSCIPCFCLGLQWSQILSMGKCKGGWETEQSSAVQLLLQHSQAVD